MKQAYLDSSCLVALALGESRGPEVADRLRGFDHLVASGLLEAEVSAAFVREQVVLPEDLYRDLRWIHPERRLSAEIEQAAAHGHTRGADLWHLACALYFRSQAGPLAFLTLDQRQRDVAAALGFPT